MQHGDQSDDLHLTTESKELNQACVFDVTPFCSRWTLLLWLRNRLEHTWERKWFPLQRRYDPMRWLLMMPFITADGDTQCPKRPIGRRKKNKKWRSAYSGKCDPVMGAAIFRLCFTTMTPPEEGQHSIRATRLVSHSATVRIQFGNCTKSDVAEITFCATKMLLFFFFFLPLWTCHDCDAIALLSGYSHLDES